MTNTMVWLAAMIILIIIEIVTVVLLFMGIDMRRD